MSSIFNRIRSKSISSINQLTGSFPTIPSGPPGYCYIENFEFTTEEECIKIDNENLNLYRKNKQLYDEITKKIETKNALFKIEKAPASPLEPNNYEKFIKYKQRNITKNVRLQTFAVQKLLEKGYKLHFEPLDIKTDTDFEPYQAIELLEKIEDDAIENLFKNQHLLPEKSSTLSIDHPPYYPPQPQPPSQYYPYQYYPHLYTPPPPNFSPPTLHRNVAPPASHSHLISNA